MDYIVHLLILIGIYLILAQSFNLTFGLGRLFNLAHVAVYAIGAYTTALLATDHGFGFLSCMVFSMVLGAFFALLIGLISMKLSQDYFAIGTLAFSAIISALLINWKSLTRGVLGIPGIPRPVVFGVELHEISHFLIYLYVIVFIVLTIFYLLMRSSYARTLRAQSESDIFAMALARNTSFVRTISFAIASAGAGLAGSIFAYYMNYIDPSSFSLTEMVFVLTIAIVGRPGSYWGVIAASIFLVLLPEPLRFITISPSILGPMRQMLHALILFAVLYMNRERLFPVERQV